MLKELLYFGVFGGFVFLGSCLAANKAAGNTSIIFSAVSFSNIFKKTLP